MRITISPLLEDEISAFVRLELDAFRSHPRIPMLWRTGYTDDLYAFYESNKQGSFRDSECRFMKAVDENGQLMAVSEWAFVLDPEKHTEGKKPVNPDGLPPSDWPALGNWELRRFFTLNLEKWERQYLAGRPYISKSSFRFLSHAILELTRLSELDILVTHPDFQGRGAGSQLLAWGVDQADRHGIIMALESTPAGLSLYKRFGFEEADVIKADMKQFGWDKPYDEESAKRVWMIRQPGSQP